MKNIYAKTSEKTFKILASLLCFIGDIMISKYIYNKFTNKEKFDEMMALILKMYKQQGIDFPAGIETQLYKITVSGLLLMIGLFVCVHVINYLFFMLNKKFAYLYTKFLSFTAVFGALLMSFMVFSTMPGWGFLFLLQGLFYFYVAYGLKMFPFKEPHFNQEVT